MNENKNKIAIFWMLMFSMSLVFVFSLWNSVYAEETTTDEPTEEELEKAEEAEEDIDKYEEKLKKEQKAREVLQVDVNNLQYSINSTQSEINKTEGKIEDAEDTIKRKESEIEQLNSNAEFQKEVLVVLLREIYYQKKESTVSIVLRNKDLSKILDDVDQIYVLESKSSSIIKDIEENKKKVIGDKKDLEDTIKEHEGLLELKEDQQRALSADKAQVQVKVNEKDATISQLNAKLSKLKSELSSLLGKSYDFDDIKDAAKFASKATGVRKDFLLGMLVVESDLGRYTGGCNYKESRMNDNRKKIFKQICEDLDHNYKKMKVSCPPSGYTGTGGAMGVAQFMSDTWMGYQGRIASATGHNPPDPWNLTDGVTAMAIKLGNDGATKKSGECRAAMRYLGGSHQWYCDKVLYWADNYESKM